MESTLPHLLFWNYFLISVFVAVEGPIATLVGAGAASTGILNPLLVFVSAAIGNLTADSLWYTLGYAGKIEWISRVGRWFRLKQPERQIQHLVKQMNQHAPKILFVAKLTAGFMIPSLIAAGLARVPWKRWFPVIFLGELLWTGTLVALGYFAVVSLREVERGMGHWVLFASILFVLALVFLAQRALRKRKASSAAKDGSLAE